MKDVGDRFEGRGAPEGDGDDLARDAEGGDPTR